MFENKTRYSDKSKYEAIRDDYMTPPSVYNPLLNYFNRSEFDIDLCCTKHNIPAKKHYTKENDGLIQDWQGLCFCNPPWKPAQKWLKRGAKLTAMDRGLTICFVLPSDRLYVGYMQDCVINNPYAAFCILPKKQGFIIPGEEEKPPVPSVGTMIVIMSQTAPDIVYGLNYYETFNTTVFLGNKLKKQNNEIQLNLMGENHV